MKPKIFVHGSYIGTTGYNNHTRDFFRELSNHVELKVRNFTIGSSWQGLSNNCHDDEPYFTELDKKLLYEQILWVTNDSRDNFKIYKDESKEFFHDFNIILSETNHHLFFDHYHGPKIAYNVWESTRQPEGFFNKLKEFDELWVPSQWQKDCTIEQGYDPDKVKVVPEGVDVHTFFPEKVDLLDEYKDGRFKFLLFGRWDYRKSTKEIIEIFLQTFSESEPVDLVVSIDNPWGKELDGFETTEERLENYGLIDPRIKIIHFPSREDYIKYLKTGHVFVSCARSEGWNLPLIEAMACGTPSIYSNCSAQLEFAEGKGIPVRIKELKSANENSYARFRMSDLPGYYYEPDFSDLSFKMRHTYENYDKLKKIAVKESEDLRKNFSWERIGEIGFDTVKDFYSKITNPEFFKDKRQNQILVSFLDGPRVEVVGDYPREYLVEFLNTNNEVIYSSKISNGMWTACGKKYFMNWKIRVNGEIVHELDLNEKEVMICLESKSLGDTIAWAPYAVDFQKKHNCKVIVSTFHNHFFENLENYKNIKFIKPGESHSCYALYRLGWFRDSDGLLRNFDLYPNTLNTIPLQQTATDILGLPYYEMSYGIDYKPKPKPIKKKYIVFGPQATAGCKEWVYEYWCQLSKMIKDIGYEIIILTQTPFHIEGTTNVCNKPIQEVMNYLFHAELFIGLGSGLSWLNWSLGKKTVMINGFSEEGHEFSNKTVRISNDKCIKCWNDSVIPFDAGDWNWCPVYKGTEKQHICQRSITPIQVFEKLEL